MQTAVIAIVVFSLIIFVHEFGHYIFAKLSGIRVEEFSIGMGPKLVGKQWGETLYSIRLFPLGGFCKMSGEMGNDGYEETDVVDSRRFDQKSVWARFSVTIGGPLMNFLLAALIFVLIFTILGVPVGFTTEIGQVIPDGAAEASGIKAGDIVTEINDVPLETWNDMVKIIHGSAGKNLLITVERAGKELEISVVPILNEESNVGMIGISPKTARWERIGLLAGIKEGLNKTYEITSMTLTGLAQIITGKSSTADIAGPVGIVKMIDESARFGIIYLANLVALISISLGLFNLLPIPALDGGRLMFIFAEIIRGRPINPARENMVHLIGFALLMLLMILVTYRDIIRLIG